MLKFFNSRLRHAGFTLIELLVVIAVIGILSSIGLASYTGAQKRARDARRMSDLEELQKSLMLYYSDNNQYPDTGGGGYTNVSNLSLSAYIKQMPDDPLAGRDYYYKHTESRQCFCLSGDMEVDSNGKLATGCTAYPGHDYTISCP